MPERRPTTRTGEVAIQQGHFRFLDAVKEAHVPAALPLLDGSTDSLNPSALAQILREVQRRQRSTMTRWMRFRMDWLFAIFSVVINYRFHETSSPSIDGKCP